MNNVEKRGRASNYPTSLEADVCLLRSSVALLLVSVTQGYRQYGRPSPRPVAKHSVPMTTSTRHTKISYRKNWQTTALGVSATVSTDSVFEFFDHDFTTFTTWA